MVITIRILKSCRYSLVWQSLGDYHGLSMFPTANSYVKALTPDMTLFGGGVCKKEVKLTKVIQVGPWPKRISVLRKRDTRELTHSLHVHAWQGHVSTQWHGGCLKTSKRAFTRNRVFWCLDPGILASTSAIKQFYKCLLFEQICSILLWQSESAETETKTLIGMLEHISGLCWYELCFRTIRLSLQWGTVMSICVNLYSWAGKTTSIFPGSSWGVTDCLTPGSSKLSKKVAGGERVLLILWMGYPPPIVPSSSNF